MNGYQGIVIKLIGEIDEICKENGISYCASDALAWGASHDGTFTTSGSEAILMMMEDDIERFESAFNAKEMPSRRLISHVHDAKGCEFAKYVATDTTYIYFGNIDDSDCYGMAVKIKPLRSVDGAFEYGSPFGGTVVFSSNPIKDSARKKFETIEIPTPNDSASFFATILKMDECPDSYIGPNPTIGDYSVTSSCSVPYSVFLEAYEGVDGIELAADNPIKRIFDWFNAEYKPTSKKVDALNCIDQVSASRFRLFQRYYPKKDRLLSAWSEGRKELVSKAFDDYAYWTKRLYADGYAIYFDAELFDLLVEVLKYQGWENADKLDALVPKRHREEPLVDVFGEYL